MKRLLMIMTSHRLDCLKICLHCHEQANSYAFFDKVVFLLNGVVGEHLDYVNQYMAERPDVDWDTVVGPRGRSERISALENQCVERYPEHLYMKTDEDVFVAKGWAECMYETWQEHQANDQLACITPMMANTSVGLHQALTTLYPEHLDAFRAKFGKDPDPDGQSETRFNPEIGIWGNQLFIDLEAANEENRKRLDSYDGGRWFPFSFAFTVCAVVFDYRHWQNMGGIPPKDEPEWCAWIEDHGHTNVLDRKTIAIHYSYGVQQDWIDRSTLLEDIRCSLVGDLKKNSLAYHLPRWKRIIPQIPRATRRKLQFLFGR